MRWAKPLSSNSDKRAKESALILRTLIVGASSNDYATPKLTKAVAKPQLSKVKSQLMQPNSANRVIAQLRTLPVLDDAANGKAPPLSAPIHAVCLALPDAEEHDVHFAQLTPDADVTSSKFVPNVAAASLDRLTRTFSEMHIVDLISAPDLGLGQPGDGKGLLAGALPTAETVITGIEQVTPQLMALGYATGRAVLPDHKGVHPPTDRISVLTYWWGLEIVLPSPTLDYLSKTQSIAGTVVNFLTALSMMNNGVREILPFVRYISQFIDFEFNAIKRQDQGKGVVCAATWLLNKYKVPRPWDFPPPEPNATLSQEDAIGGHEGGELSPLNPQSLIPNPAVSVPLPTTPSPPTTAPLVVPSISPTIPSDTPTTPNGTASLPIFIHNSQTVITPGALT
ncbi:hypothetical protein C8F04DRAFT_940323 [Mycena alexandri]|uniref:Uncharacterized protein n=1 Tax=Mycena alexandri TaxID=1745969 RepID=A0AAD6TH03_9AGAR|nr:hypothetical protein C8F04DRAFT_940323 [Mycena alexandri]